mmetsp:Transcript_43038/g.107760  ORF Transcript_43038/g.107760 Transcript_43038/m.107760 type:complete len:317 (-) Transcript_43038:21-971(-)
MRAQLAVAGRAVEPVLDGEVGQQPGRVVHDLDGAQEKVVVHLVHVLTGNHDGQLLCRLARVHHLGEAGRHVHVRAEPALLVQLGGLLAALERLKVHVLPLLALRQLHHRRHRLLPDLLHERRHLANFVRGHDEVALRGAAREDPAHLLQPEEARQLLRLELLLRAALQHQAGRAPLLRRLVDDVRLDVAALVHGAVQNAGALDGEAERVHGVRLEHVGGVAVKGDGRHRRLLLHLNPRLHRREHLHVHVRAKRARLKLGIFVHRLHVALHVVPHVQHLAVADAERRQRVGRVRHVLKLLGILGHQQALVLGQDLGA